MSKTKTAPEALKPYVQRAITDPDLRDDLLAAFAAARSIYDQVSEGRGIKGKAEKVSEKDVQKQLQRLVDDLSGASDKLKDSKKSHKARNRFLLLTGITIGALYNPWTGQATRDWISDQISGDGGSSFDDLPTDPVDVTAGNGSIV